MPDSNTPEPPPETSPRDALLQIVNTYMLSQCVYVAANWVWPTCCEMAREAATIWRLPQTRTPSRSTECCAVWPATASSGKTMTDDSVSTRWANCSVASLDS